MTSPPTTPSHKSLIQTLCIFLLGFISVSDGFSLSSFEPHGVTTVQLGGSVTLGCTSNDYYEWCSFKHGDTQCEYQWLRDPYNITVLDCADYTGRAIFVGYYNGYECAITLSDIQATDTGAWECILEEYHGYGNRGIGAIVNVTINLDVPVPITTTTTTTTTTTAATSSTPSVSNNEVSNDGDAARAEAEDKEGDYSSSDQVDAGQSIYVVIAVVIIVAVLLTSIVLSVLHFRQKLPQSFYAMGGKKWKPVLGTEEFPVTEDDESKTPIIKNGTIDMESKAAVIDETLDKVAFKPSAGAAESATDA